MQNEKPATEIKTDAVVDGPDAERNAGGGVLCAIFFVSGTAALIFETLWFRQAGLTFGSSVWASSIVLASFMAARAGGPPLPYYRLCALCRAGRTNKAEQAARAMTDLPDEARSGVCLWMANWLGSPSGWSYHDEP